eukprot:m51a1_g4975 Conserved oligomeric Golgi complex subunit 1 (898) ;mRNA; f:18838-21864
MEGVSQRAIEAEADRVFEQFPSDDVRSKVTAARTDIIQRKQELRKFVGEHYKELLEVADSVLRVRDVSSQLLAESQRAASDAAAVRPPHLQRAAPERQIPSPRNPEIRESPAAVAASMRAVVHAPDIMCSAMDSGDFSTAAAAYLAAQAAHSSLPADVLANAPVVARQWASAAMVAKRVLQLARGCLEREEAGTPELSDALACLLLLSLAPPSALFRDFLAARSRSALRALSAPARDAAAARASLARLVAALSAALRQTDAIFCAQPDDARRCALADALAPFLPRAGDLPADAALALRRCAAPACAGAGAVALEDVRVACAAWLRDVCDAAAPAVARLLAAHAATAAEVALAAAEVQGALAAAAWRAVCLRTMGAEWPLWPALFDAPLLARAREAVSAQFAAAAQAFGAELDARVAGVAAAGHEGDVGAWVWRGAGAAAGAGALGAFVGERSPYAQTPAVRSLVSVLDARLRSAVDDAAAVAPTIDDSAALRGASPGAAAAAGLSKHERELAAHARAAFAQAMADVAARMAARLALETTAAGGAGGDRAAQARAAFVGRAAAAVSRHVRTVQCCGCPAAARAALHAVQARSVVFWAASVARPLVADFERRLAATRWAARDSWEPLQLAPDERDAPTSPAHASPALWSLLLGCARAATAAYGHAPPRCALSALVRAAGDAALAAYARLAAPPSPLATLEGRVQAWFDVAFVGEALQGRALDPRDPLAPAVAEAAGHARPPSAQQAAAEADAWRAAVDAAACALRAGVDPVDVRFFEPRVRAAVQRCLSRGQMFLAALWPAQHVSEYKARGAGQEMHSILPTVKAGPRFVLLPAVVQTASGGASLIMDPAMQLRRTRSVSPPSASLSPSAFLHQQQQQQQQQAQAVNSPIHHRVLSFLS